MFKLWIFNQTSKKSFDYGVQRDLNTSEVSNTQTLLRTKNILLSAGNIYAFFCPNDHLRSSSPSANILLWNLSPLAVTQLRVSGLGGLAFLTVSLLTYTQHLTSHGQQLCNSVWIHTQTILYDVLPKVQNALMEHQRPTEHQTIRFCIHILFRYGRKWPLPPY